MTQIYNKMNTVKINKSELQIIIKENYEKYKNLYDASLQTYWEAVEKELNKGIQLVKKQLKDKTGPIYSFTVQAQMPDKNHDSYERILRMLELSVDTEIELSVNDFDKYVRNKWEWRERYMQSIYSNAYMAYGVKGVSGPEGAPGIYSLMQDF